MTEETSRLTVKERGYAGHFCCSAWCRYTRNTLISDRNNHIIVSSVGNYHLPRGEDTPMGTIGNNRLYETMVFLGKEKDGYIDIVVKEQIYISDSLPWSIEGRSEKDLPENVDNIMDIQHNNIVEWVKKNFYTLKPMSRSK